MKVIQFDETGFNHKLNLAVRQFDEHAGEIGKFYINTFGGIEGQVVKTVTLQFEDITHGSLSDHHIPQCRSVNGLSQWLEDRYGQVPHVVTLIYFVVEG